MSVKMLDDPRRIVEFIFCGEERRCCSVGSGGVTKIECYGEPGQEVCVPW